ncbi:MAG: hypothetical protein BGP04_14905 [Rhizobiales bacterium 62-17]|nr:hypothetical protein [Hyphomicrobiales bacterium]OJY03076.1 MAG: hypothetical protein BGP04_14905 [Rhizobiales bacterium 62-17]
MKKFALAGAALAAVLSLAACNTPGERAAGGAVIGGAGGALVGAAVSGGSAGGTLAGAAIGAAGGAVIGANTAPRYGYGCRRWGYNYYGRRVCVR